MMGVLSALVALASVGGPPKDRDVELTRLLERVEALEREVRELRAPREAENARQMAFYQEMAAAQLQQRAAYQRMHQSELANQAALEWALAQQNAANPLDPRALLWGQAQQLAFANAQQNAGICHCIPARGEALGGPIEGA